MRKDEIKRDVSRAIDRIFANGKNKWENKGKEDNHCNEKTLEYFAALARGDKEALQKQRDMIERMGKEDFSDLEEELRKL